MTMTDPVADLLTRIRNGVAAKKKLVAMPTSGIKASICEVLKREGFIDSFEVAADGITGELRVKLKYDSDGVPAIRDITRESKPGRRVYHAVRTMPRVLNGHGIAVLSTSKGVMSDREARKARIGGEFLCSVF
jgi:small subunit ribosomal protein S8